MIKGGYDYIYIFNVVNEGGPVLIETYIDEGVFFHEHFLPTYW